MGFLQRYPAAHAGGPEPTVEDDLEKWNRCSDRIIL